MNLDALSGRYPPLLTQVMMMITVMMDVDDPPLLTQDAAFVFPTSETEDGTRLLTFGKAIFRLGDDDMTHGQDTATVWTCIVTGASGTRTPPPSWTGRGRTPGPASSVSSVTTGSSSLSRTSHPSVWRTPPAGER